MITVEQACSKVLKNHPGEYIHNINEYANGYEFILLNKGESVGKNTCMMVVTVVNKNTGELIEHELLGMGTLNSGDYQRVPIP